MTTPRDPQDGDSTDRDRLDRERRTRGLQDTGGQQPTTEPRGGRTSYEAGGSIRDRLRSAAGSSDAIPGDDSRTSDVSSDSFVQSDSRGELAAHGRGHAQHSGSRAPEAVRGQEPRAADLDEAAARSAERVVAALFMLALVGVVGFFWTFWFAPFKFAVEEGNEYYTPLLGFFMALALVGIGAGAVQWAKTLMDDEEAVQERHPPGSPVEEREATAVALKQGLAQSGLPRRKLLRNTLLLGGGSLALLPVPLLFSLGHYQNKERALAATGWAKGVRLVRSGGTPVKLGDLQVGSAESVFPGVPGGEKLPDSATLLIRMRPEEVKAGTNPDWAVGGHIAYSVICTHLGCPVKLYEQQTHNLFCPCHQSTFDAADGCKVLFGPAARALPQLAISVDPEGYFVAGGDYAEPVGPSYWERKPTYGKKA